jgi:hypothetical protein
MTIAHPDLLLRAGDLLVHATAKVALANSQGYAAADAHAILSGIAPMANRFFHVPRKMRG